MAKSQIPASFTTFCKIVVTAGPASRRHFADLIRAGASIFRINAAHGDARSNTRLIRSIRRAAAALHRPVWILLDLAGPKARVGRLRREPRRLKPGQTVVLVPDPPCHAREIPIRYGGLTADLRPGHRVLLADGTIELRVEAVDPPHITTRIVHGGLLLTGKGVNFPDIPTRLPALTEKDLQDLAWGLAAGADMLSLSFVRSAQNLMELKRAMTRLGYDVPIVAKIEKPQALDHLDEILSLADGVMVARGDLGVELPFDEIGLHQKAIIRSARQHARPVITATQMLISMVDQPYPTRAEVADITNAVLDGTDAVMLSDETARGRHPVAAVQVLERVVRRTEQYITERERVYPYREVQTDATPQHAVCYAAYELAQRVDARALLVPTWSGSTARLIAAYRPRQPILAATPLRRTHAALALVRGVIPVLIEAAEDPAHLQKLLKEHARALLGLAPGSPVVITAGLPLKEPGRTNWIYLDAL